MSESTVGGSVVYKLEVDDSEFQSTLRRASRQNREFSDDIGRESRRGTSSFNELAASVASVGVGLAAAAGLVSSLKSFGTFEQSINVLGEVTSSTDAQLAKLSATAVQLGRDTELPGTSAADAAAAMLELGKAGLNVNEVLGAAKGTLQAAKAGNIGVADSAKIVAQALNAFSLEGKEAIKVADILAGAANASSFDIDELGLALSQTSQSAKTAGVPLNDTVTAIAALGNAGLQASDAGTSLKTFFNTLTPDSKEAAAAMDKLGISFFDAKGNFVGLSETSERLQNAFSGLTQEQRLSTAEAIFGSDAQRAALVLADKGAEGFNELASSVNKAGAASKLAGAQTKGIAGAMGALSSSVETAAIEFGRLIAPAVEPALRGIADALNWVVEGLRTGNPFIQALVIFLGVLAVGLIAVATAFGVVSIAGGIFAAVFSPIGLTVLAVVAAIAALAAIAFVVVANWSTIADFFSGLWSKISQEVSQFVTNIGQFFRSLWQGVTDTVGKMVTGVSDATGQVIQFFRELPGKAISALGDFAGDMYNAGKDAITGFGNGVKDFAGSVYDGAAGVAGGTIDFFKEKLGIHSPSTVFAEIGKNTMLGLAEGITGSTSSVLGAMGRVGSKLSGAADFSALAPDMVTGGFVGDGAGSKSIVLNETYNINSSVDMERERRNQAWRLANI